MRRYLGHTLWLAGFSLAIGLAMGGCGPIDTSGDETGGSDTTNDSGSNGDDSGGDDSDGGDTSSDIYDIESLFPDPTIDVDDADDELATAKSNNASKLGDGQIRTVRAGVAITNAFQFAAFEALALARQVRNDVTSAAQTYAVGELKLADGTSVPYIADFSAFDIDGDGVADGSGNVQDVPVAVRMWADNGSGYQRFLAAVIEERRTPTHLGQGRFFVHPNAAISERPADLQIAMAWDRNGDSHRWNEGFVSGQLSDDYAFEIGAARVDLRSGGEANLEKTIRSNSLFTASPLNFETYKLSVHYGITLPIVALISAESTGSTLVDANFSGQCVMLNGSEPEADACALFDTSDVDFLETPTGSEADFPADFSEEPPSEDDILNDTVSGDADASDGGSNTDAGDASQTP